MTSWRYRNQSVRAKADLRRRSERGFGGREATPETIDVEIKT